MASRFCLLCRCTAVPVILVLVVATTCSTEATREFEVGDEFGWREPELENSTMYIQWAERNRFQIGDTLRFEYKNDSVFMVDKWNYYHCNTSHYIVAFNNGNSTFKLHSSGPFYFVSGNMPHCKNGQRLLVEVMSIHIPHYHSPPSISLPPQSSDSAPAAAPLSSSAAMSLPTLTVPITMALSLSTFVVCLMHAP